LGNLGLRDAETGAALPVKWEESLFSGLAYMSLTDRMSMEGRSAVVETLGTARDRAGLSWVADSTTHVLHPSGPAELEHDFSLEPAGLGNGAEYFPPGAVQSPCEAGGCVLLEGETCRQGEETCAERPYLVVVLRGIEMDVERRYGIARYRLLARGPGAEDLYWSSSVIEAGGLVGVSSGSQQAAPLSEPIHGYTHGFDSYDVYDGFYPAEEEKTYVYLLPHHEDGEQPVEVAVIIDWVVASECPVLDCP
jgi:hypothetical protein